MNYWNLTLYLLVISELVVCSLIFYFSTTSITIVTISTSVTSVSLVTISAVTSGGCPHTFTCRSIQAESRLFITFVVNWKFMCFIFTFRSISFYSFANIFVLIFLRTYIIFVGPLVSLFCHKILISLVMDQSNTYLFYDVKKIFTSTNDNILIAIDLQETSLCKSTLYFVTFWNWIYPIIIQCHIIKVLGITGKIRKCCLV